LNLFILRPSGTILCRTVTYFKHRNDDVIRPKKSIMLMSTVPFCGIFFSFVLSNVFVRKEKKMTILIAL